jgi:hypothetical protein
LAIIDKGILIHELTRAGQDQRVSQSRDTSCNYHGVRNNRGRRCGKWRRRRKETNNSIISSTHIITRLITVIAPAILVYIPPFLITAFISHNFENGQIVSKE